jgi:(1->4)-alpha-D-glucan 1-alpha-D-glucosylmutase
MLQEIRAKAADSTLELVEELLATRTDDRIKLFLTTQMLQARKAYPVLFQKGTYRPLRIQGKYANCAIAFARCHQNTVAIALAPRFLTALVQPDSLPLGEVWAETQIDLPPEWGTRWKNPITGESSLCDGVLPLEDAFRHFPGALLVSQR